MDAGVLPVKRLDRAKGRLAGAYTEADRAWIADALLEDALTLCERASFLRWWVVSDDPSVLERAGARGFEILADDGRGLNQALAAALRAVTEARATSAMIVPVDVPLARPEDLLDLLDTGATSDLVVVPSGDDGGTSALYLRPPDLIEPRFGPDSLRSHIHAAEAGSFRCSVLHLERLALDIDTAQDVTDYLGRADSGRAFEVLSSLAAER